MRLLQEQQTVSDLHLDPCCAETRAQRRVVSNVKSMLSYAHSPLEAGFFDLM